MVLRLERVSKMEAESQGDREHSSSPDPTVPFSALCLGRALLFILGNQAADSEAQELL